MKFGGALSLLCLALLCVSTCYGGALKDMLDGMQHLMTGSDTFDESFYAELVACFEQFDPRLLAAVDGQWAGLLEYAGSGGDPETDPWHRCPQEKWFESNCTTQEYGQVPIFEPCNYASNIAYYHTALEICKKQDWALPQEHVTALFRAFSYLGQGSAFLHGSQTLLGDIFDTRTNNLFAFVAHQAAVSRLEDVPIIHHIADEPRERTGAQVTEDLLPVFATSPVSDWAEVVGTIDVPPIRVGLCTYLVTALDFVLEEEVLDAIAEYLMSILGGVTPDMSELCLEKYLPALRNATLHIELSPEQQAKMDSLVGVVMGKLLYAAVWQEEILGNNTFILSPEGNEIGAALLPIVNTQLNKLTDIEYYDPAFQLGRNIYPGEDWCNPLIPHAKWHLQTGVGLFDLVVLADEMYKLLV